MSQPRPGDLKAVASYSRLLSLYGPDSPQATRFLAEHPGDERLVELTDTARRLRESAAVQERKSRERATYLGQQIRSKSFWRGAALALIAVALIVLALFYETKRRAASEQRRATDLFHYTNDAAWVFISSGVWRNEESNDPARKYNDAVGRLAQEWPPESYPGYWEKQTLYIWVRSEFDPWLSSGEVEPTPELLRRIELLKEHLRRRKETWGRVDLLNGQIELWAAHPIEVQWEKGEGDQEQHRSQLEERYKQAVDFNSEAIKKASEAITKAANENGSILDPELSIIARQNRAYSHQRLGAIAKTPKERVAELELARVDAEETVKEARLLFLRNRTTIFTTCLDTLGTTYEDLLKAYEELDERDRPVDFKGLVCKVLATYTDIELHYRDVDFSSMGPLSGEYRAYKQRNEKRLEKLRKMVAQKGIDCSTAPL
jgi:hypothetical protein